MICLAAALCAFASAACGVVLPPASEGDGPTSESGGAREPTTTAAANLPATSGVESDSGVGAPAPPPAPTTTPARVYAVFVSSDKWASDEIRGLVGADQKCTDLANAGVSALHGKKWAAWLSDEANKASARLGGTPGPWARPDAQLVASDVAHLVGATPLFVAIALDEKMGVHDGDVWTGTRADGLASSSTCANWQATSGKGIFGVITIGKPAWTASAETECDGNYWTGPSGSNDEYTKPRRRLYCFEID